MSAINDFELLIDLIRKAVDVGDRFKYSVPRLGEIKSVDDDLNKGRVLCTCPDLGWNNDSQAVWAYPKQTGGLCTLKVGDWVVLEWLGGKRDSFVMYSRAYWMSDSIPDSFDGKPTTHILFEDNSGDFSIVYDEEEKKLSIINKNSDVKFSIVLDKDGIKVLDKENQYWFLDTKNKLIEFLSTNNVRALIDGANKKIELNDGSNKYTSDESAGTQVLENKSGKKYEATATSIKLTGASGSLEIL